MIVSDATLAAVIGWTLWGMSSLWLGFHLVSHSFRKRLPCLPLCDYAFLCVYSSGYFIGTAKFINGDTDGFFYLAAALSGTTMWVCMNPLRRALILSKIQSLAEYKTIRTGVEEDGPGHQDAGV